MSSAERSPNPDFQDNWAVYAASVTGRGHVQRNQPGQDRFDWKKWGDSGNETPVLVMVCADGAGSARRSWAGARVACRSMIHLIDQRMKTPAGRERLSHADGWNDEYIHRLFRQVRGRAFGWGESINSSAQELATTLNLAVLGPDFGCFAQVGDGLIGFRATRENAGWELANQPENGEFAGETTFLTSENWLEKLAVRRFFGSVEQAFVSTDGLAPILFQSATYSVHQPFLDPLFKGLGQDSLPEELKSEKLAEFLKSDRVAGRCDDDLTLMLVRNDFTRPH